MFPNLLSGNCSGSAAIVAELMRRKEAKKRSEKRVLINFILILSLLLVRKGVKESLFRCDEEAKL